MRITLQIAYGPHRFDDTVRGGFSYGSAQSAQWETLVLRIPTRCGAVRIFVFENPMVRCGVDFRLRESYGAVRCGF